MQFLIFVTGIRAPPFCENSIYPLLFFIGKTYSIIEVRMVKTRQGAKALTSDVIRGARGMSGSDNPRGVS